MRLHSSLVAVSALAVFSGLALTPRISSAQIAGTTSKPIPDVLLLVDTSGSMERFPDGTSPDDYAASSPNACNPGTSSSPNKWGMLVQALTGNMQPYYSCESLSRSSTAAPPLFTREYQINNHAPYDADYALNYHRPVTGDSSSQCVMAPYRLPGSTLGGVGPANNASGGSATDFPDDALASVKLSYLNGLLTGNAGLPSTITSDNQCIFAQGNDGQLDAAKDFVRFALMTFDNDVNPAIGVTGSFSGTNTVDTTTTPQAPFLGAWSYVRHSGNEFYGTPSSDLTTGAALGRPMTNPACSFSSQEVGARNEGAPPWEGRLVKFPSPSASLFDLERQNDQLQKVLIASRPYGATPIDGMFDDARDYYLNYENGPSGTNPNEKDLYACRPRFIVLLTDGAPNLDLRPSCSNGVAGAGDRCPYPKTASEIALALAQGTGPNKVLTYVIGFAVSGEGSSGNGFPTGTATANQNCKGWYADPAGGASNPTTMQNTCLSVKPAAGTTAAACCKLNEIALAGSSDGTGNQVGAFFAESQADVVLSFGRILSNITQSASTRTVPAFTPTAQFSDDSFGTATTQNVSGQFVASFIPSTQRPWSGDIDRTRFQCSAATPSLPVPVAQNTTAGDSESFNLAAQTVADKRTIISVRAKAVGVAIDSATTIRPYANASSSTTGGDLLNSPDGSLTYTGTELGIKGGVLGSSLASWPAALNVDKYTCKRSRAVLEGTSTTTAGTQIVPALDDVTNGPLNCTDVVWGFATAYPHSLKYSGTPASAGAYEFNVRCDGSNATGGQCSISGTSCTIGGPIPIPGNPDAASNGCATGQVCVPQCSALGAIYHSNPVVVGPPNDFLREEGFRQYAAARRARLPITYVASIDGLLHAFKSMVPGGPEINHELWAFAPPAVLPRLASNYPQGNQTILDGTPVVAEAIWDRALAQTSGTDASKQWHTTLVAGLGGGGGGYYALNVTDADCGNGSNKACFDSYAAPSGTLAEVSNSGVIDSTTKVGPHFLWQLTDIVKGTSAETAKVERSSTITSGGGPLAMMALFGKNTSTPAIAMMQIGDRQIGVAILPGGYEDPPIAGATCPRSPNSYSMADIAVGSTRPAVRQWSTDCTAKPVPGRGVTIVRLDTGEIIRHFGRNFDTPLRAQSKIFTETYFDSPMTGTPVVYPSGIGVPIQKIFIGDADGTLWRIDVSSTSPNLWKASMFQDLYAFPGGSSTGGQPVAVVPAVSTDDAGNVVLHVATGDQDSIVLNSLEKDVVFSITETRDGSNNPKAQVNWYNVLSNGERVTGPMVVFDHTLYFATYQPAIPSTAACTDVGNGKLWGLDYVKPYGTTAASGGLNRWCPSASVNATTGVCGAVISPAPTGESQGPALIPGVTLQTTASCSTVGPALDEYGAGSFSAMTPVSYSLSFGQSQANSAGSSSSPQAARGSLKRQLPQNSTKIDSWSIVIE